jgi:uncharacterized membrane protein YpjA
MRIAAALGAAFVTTLAAYSLLMVGGAYVFPERSSFTVLFWYLGVLAPVACLYLAVRVLRLFKFPAELGQMIAFAIVGLVALSIVNTLMGSINSATGSELAWRYVAMLAIVHLITFVCPILIFGKRLLGE